MSMTDPIADMLTRIRNAIHSGHDKVDIPASFLKEQIAKILKDEGFISNYRVIKDGKQGIIRITLRYVDRRSILKDLQRISKPGRRIYAGKDDLPAIRGGLGVAIVSTSKGVMTDAQAREMGVGGEVLCAVW